jgi:hypothetical protein
MIHMMNAVAIHAGPARLSMLRRLAIVSALAMVYLMPVAARASSSSDEEKAPTDARLENYPQKVTLEEGGTAFSWIIFLVLAALCVGVMLKSANRSHLD